MRHYAKPERTFWCNATTGNDANRGNSQDQAWATIGKLNAQTFLPGDTIIMDGTFSDATLLIPSSGAPWRYIKFVVGPSGTAIINKAANYGVNTNGKNYVLFRGIDGTSGNRTYYNNDSHHIFILDADCTNTTADESSINIASSTDGLSHHVWIEGCSIHDTPGWGVAAGTNQVDSVTIKHCTFSMIGTLGGVQDHSIYFTNVSNFYIENNTISDSYFGGIKLVESGGKVTSGTIYRNTITGSGRSASSGAGISLDGVTHRVVIASNLITDGNQSGVCVGIGVVNTACSNIEIYNNTIVRHYLGINMDISPTGWIVKNNNIVQDFAWIGNSLRCCIYIADADITNNTFQDNNYWFNDGAGSRDPIKVGAGAITFAAWQAKPGSPDSTGTNVDPLFVTEYTDLHLQVGSTLRGSASVLADVVSDRDGVVLDASPDVGGYQYV